MSVITKFYKIYKFQKYVFTDKGCQDHVLLEDALGEDDELRPATEIWYCHRTQWVDVSNIN